MGEPEKVEISPEMAEALRILREDHVIANTAAARKANEDLLARLDARDKADEERWAKFEERTKGAPPEPSPENDTDPTPGVPPAPPVVPEGEKKPVEMKRRGIWFPSGDDEGEVK